MPRRPLESEHFQVVVIGGGVHGVAIARECARAGRRTLLVEQHDFASGSTSRATRMIHGGLRYLEDGEIGLVRDCLRERQKLLQERPHLIRPQQFLLALSEGSRRSAMSIRTGMWLYRRMAGANLQADSDRDDIGRLERLLDSGRRWTILDYEDAQCEFPERLVAEWLTEAMEAGAEVRNHTQVLAVDIRQGRARGVLLRDQLSGKEERIESLAIINATGPWADRLCQRSQINMKAPMVGGVRGSHIVVPKFAGAPGAAVFTEASDGRPFFMTPWNEQILVGSTEIADRGDPAKAKASSEEIEYLLGSLRRLFPQIRLSKRDVRYAYAGIRPLPFAQANHPAAESRRFFLHDHAEDGASNLISIIGGKLTLAAQVAREVAEQLGIPARRPSTMALAGEGNLNPLLDRWVLEVAKAAGISETSAQAIVDWHGRRSPSIARLAGSANGMRAALCPHTGHLVAEAVDALQHECAVTLADVLLRRVPVALGACWSPECSREATARVAAVMGWNAEQAAEELETLEMERSAFLCKPSSLAAAMESAAD